MLFRSNWITKLNPANFWAIRDYKKLWVEDYPGINSSVMYWHTEKFADIWTQFTQQDLAKLRAKYHGDQDYLSTVLKPTQRRFLPEKSALSWRWQALDGGIDPLTRRHLAPGTGTRFELETSLLIFHGQPKPDRVSDSVIKNHWR